MEAIPYPADLPGIPTEELASIERIGDFSWHTPAELTEFPHICVRDDVLDTLSASHYIDSYEYGMELARKVVGMDINRKEFLRVRPVRKQLHRQYPKNFGKRGNVAVKRLRGKARGNDLFEQTHFTTGDINAYVNRRIRECGDKYVWYIVRDTLGNYHLIIDDAACVSNIMGARKLVGKIVDIRKMTEPISIAHIGVCCPATSADITNNNHIGFVGYGDHPDYGEITVRISNSPFMGWFKKLGNFATAGYVGAKDGWHIMHAALYRDRKTGKVVLVCGVGSWGKTEIGLPRPRPVVYFRDGHGNMHEYHLSQHSLNTTPWKLADDIVYVRVDENGRLLAFNAEAGVLHRPEEDDDHYVQHLMASDAEFCADNFRYDEATDTIDCTVMECLGGELSNNSRVFFGNEDLPEGEYYENSKAKPVEVDTIFLGHICSPSVRGEEQVFDRNTANVHPIVRMNPRQFRRSLCAIPRIITQSLASEGGDPLAASNEGFGNAAPFVLIPQGELAATQLQHFEGLDSNQIEIYGVSQRNPALTCCQDLYGVGYMTWDLLVTGKLGDVECVPDPTGLFGFIPQFDEGVVPECFRVPPSRLEHGYAFMAQFVDNGISNLANECNWDGFDQLLNLEPQTAISE